ncbi:MAG: serine/threonine-protein kinase [Polyangiales bacterium]
MAHACPQCQREYFEGETFCPFDGARLRDMQSVTTLMDQSADPLVGRLLDDRYRLHKVLGRGGAGTVFRAELETIGKPVAIKVLRKVDEDQDKAFARFEREARAASKLGEAHIIDIFDFGYTPDGFAFLVMELLQGEDLAELLARRGCIPLHEAIPLIAQCCQGLGAAHAAGIIHRDLKPENIFLKDRGAEGPLVKLVDFGLAKICDTEIGGDPARKLTTTGMIFGTPQYMSPEQCLSRPTDHRADIYAIGCILYELLTGQVPFDGETFMGVLNQHVCDPPPAMRVVNPDVVVPAAVEAVIYRCLDKEAGRRPQSMRELRDELLAALEAAGQTPLAAQLRSTGAMAEPMSFLDLTKRKPDSGELALPGAGSHGDIGDDDTILAAPLPDVDSPPPPSGIDMSATVEEQLPALGPSLGQATPKAPSLTPPAGPPSGAARAPSPFGVNEPTYVPTAPSGGTGMKVVVVGLLLLALGGALGYVGLLLFG